MVKYGDLILHSKLYILLRVISCYNGSDWHGRLPFIDFAFNASRAMGIEHTPFEANVAFSLEEHNYVLLPIRLSIYVSMVAQDRLPLLREYDDLVTNAIRLHKEK
jgi:hypothetical protein